MEVGKRSFGLDVGWVGLFSLIIFGFAGFSGRPLTMHEARLPQTSREMMWKHEWLLPTSGGRPWLERPPLPHWLVIEALKFFGHDDRVWIVRLPSAIMGTITVLLTVFIATKWFGRGVGIVSGCVLATSFKFYQYATLAEDDIFLAMLVALAAALFTHAELMPIRRIKWFGFFSHRSWPIWLFFVVMGLSNLAKGPLLGILILGGPVGIYLCFRSAIERSFQPLFRYTWLWGWIVLIALMAAWPLWAYRHVPDVLENWKYDYLGRMSGTYSAINEPWWYYPPQLAVGLLPWTPICLLGIWIGWKNRSNAGYQWILCWAIVPLILLSIPKGKHDHYLVPFLAPFAILGAVGLIDIAKKLRWNARVLVVVILLLGAGYCVGEAVFAARTDHTVDDTAFLLRCKNEVPSNIPLYIDGKLGPTGNLDFFRIQFYSLPDAVLLHNLSFLRDQQISASTVYVIARQRDEKWLHQLGSVQLVDQSSKSHDLATPAGRFTLFRLDFDPHLQRYPLPANISSLQAMERDAGPWCGPPMQ